MIYPWQEEQWQQWLKAQQLARMPHALLLTGMAGVGKTAFADAMTAALLCQKKINTFACGACHACLQFKARVHPNVIWVEPEKPTAAIKVDQIRALNEFIQQSSLQGEYRVAIITPADNLNLAAANALLKTLEEPASGALILLIHHQRLPLLATIKSRCQRLSFPTPNRQQALAFLKGQHAIVDHALLLRLAQGAPLAALQYQEELPARDMVFKTLNQLLQKQMDSIGAAAALTAFDLDWVLLQLLTWLQDVIGLQLERPTDELCNIDQVTALQMAAQTFSVQHWLDVWQKVKVARIETLRGIHLNQNLLFENLLLKWMPNHVPS